MPMHYGHPEDGDKLCRCPRCGWSGTLHQTDEFTPASGGESFQVCPKCAKERPVAAWPDDGSSPNLAIAFTVIEPDEKNT